MIFFCSGPARGGARFNRSNNGKPKKGRGGGQGNNSNRKGPVSATALDDDMDAYFASR